MTKQKVAESPFRGLATRVGLGGLAVQAWHKPLGYVKQMVSEGGPIEQYRTRKGRYAMLQAARRLPELKRPEGVYPVAVRFLSGDRFWDQTLFCIVSLQLTAEKRIDPIIFDDGTLGPDCKEAILRAVPWTRFRQCEEIEAQLNERLPSARYPTLRSRRLNYPHLRKLTDLHDPHEWSLILDSDMLFFRRPDALLAWMEQPKDGLFIQDAIRSYGYSDELMAALAHGSIPDQMNVGLYGLHGSMIDYDFIEHCVRVQLELEGANYLQEQALTALLFSRLPTTALPRRNYIVMPDLAEGREPTAVLHHYVAHSKRSYFQSGWCRVVRHVEARAAVTGTR
jgi:hypothetical protein